MVVQRQRGPKHAQEKLSLMKRHLFMTSNLMQLSQSNAHAEKNQQVHEGKNLSQT